MATAPLSVVLGDALFKFGEDCARLEQDKAGGLEKLKAVRQSSVALLDSLHRSVFTAGAAPGPAPVLPTAPVQLSPPPVGPTPVLAVAKPRGRDRDVTPQPSNGDKRAKAAKAATAAAALETNRPSSSAVMRALPIDIKDKLVAVPTTSRLEVKYRVQGSPCFISFASRGKDRTNTKVWLSGDSIRGEHDLSKVFTMANVKQHEKLRAAFLIRAVRYLSKAAAVNASITADGLNNAFEAAKADIKGQNACLVWAHESDDDEPVDEAEDEPVEVSPAAKPPASAADAAADGAAAAATAAATAAEFFNDGDEEDDFDDAGEEEEEDDDDEDYEDGF